ncbi:hypothetical protein HYT23_07060 [Candidatus Pacearchaeota archaeon]|nr:hypothetical protein [Candidatus Pacearchaeota archaeon]
MDKRHLYDELSRSNEVEITRKHSDEVGPQELRRLRNVGDRARIYYGSETGGIIGPDEVALVYEGEDRFIGTKKRHFKIVGKDDKKLR